MCLHGVVPWFEFVFGQYILGLLHTTHIGCILKSDDSFSLFCLGEVSGEKAVWFTICPLRINAESIVALRVNGFLSLDLGP